MALMLLLGAVRCIDACQLLPDAPVAKNCHQKQPGPKPPATQLCGHLSLVTTPDAGASAMPPSPPVRQPAIEFPLRFIAAFPAVAAPLGALRVPLRI